MLIGRMGPETQTKKRCKLMASSPFCNGSDEFDTPRGEHVRQFVLPVESITKKQEIHGALVLAELSKSPGSITTKHELFDTSDEFYPSSPYSQWGFPTTPCLGFDCPPTPSLFDRDSPSLSDNEFTETSEDLDDDDDCVKIEQMPMTEKPSGKQRPTKPRKIQSNYPSAFYTTPHIDESDVSDVHSGLRRYRTFAPSRKEYPKGVKKQPKAGRQMNSSLTLQQRNQRKLHRQQSSTVVVPSEMSKSDETNPIDCKANLHQMVDLAVFYANATKKLVDEKIQFLWDAITPFSIKFALFGFAIPMDVVKVSITHRHRKYACLVVSGGRFHVGSHFMTDVAHLFGQSAMFIAKSSIQKVA